MPEPSARDRTRTGWGDENPTLPIVYQAEVRWFWQVAFSALIAGTVCSWILLNPPDPSTMSARDSLAVPAAWIGLAASLAVALWLPVVSLYCPPVLRLDDEGIHLRWGLLKRWRHWPWARLAEARLESMHGQAFIRLVDISDAVASGCFLLGGYRFAAAPFVPGIEAAQRLVDRINRLRQRMTSPPDRPSRQFPGPEIAR